MPAHLLIEVGIEIGKAAVELGIEAHKQYREYKARKEREKAAAERRERAAESLKSEKSGEPSAPPLKEGSTEPSAPPLPPIAEAWCYEGVFVDGDLEGMGKMTSPSKIYTGMFRKGIFEGEGTMEYLQTGRKYVGEFSNGTYHGSGVYFGTKFTYSGTFDQGKFVYGVIIMSDGARFEGECEAYQPKRGTYLSKKGYKYIGEMKNYIYDGKGKLFYPVRVLDTGALTSVVYYEGDFVAGKAHGQGVMVWRNGKKWRGQWEENKMVKTAGEYETATPEDMAVSSLIYS